MKIVYCVHGFPPELQGGTERSALGLASSMAREGHDVTVVAGSYTAPEESELAIRRESVNAGSSASFRLERWTRPDLYFDHWHKSRSARVGTAFRELLCRERPDLVHVLHWLRLTRDLVSIAAQEGIPAVVSLGDSWISCPLTFRVRPQDKQVCERPLSGSNCIGCAGQVAPRTPWVAMEAGFLELGARTQDLERELGLARSRVVPGATFGKRQQDALAQTGLSFSFDVLPPYGVSLQRKPDLPRASEEPLRVGSWGQLSDLKGTDLLFEAINGLPEPDQIHLELAGPLESPTYLESLQERYPNVRFQWHGPFEAQELGQHPVSAVHLMLSASRAPESFGIVLEEARALGLPTLLPDLGAFAERGGESRGALLFPAGEASGLRAGLLRCLNEPGLLPGLRSKLPAAVTPEDVLKAHLALYDRARQEGSPEVAEPHQWFAERLTNFAEQEWDRALSECSPEQLGFESTH